jgi:predicted transcriptional regulator
MGNQVTVTLPDDVYRTAQRLAQLAQRDVAEVLSEALSLSFPLLPDDAEPVVFRALSDADVLAMAELSLPPGQDQRLSELLYHQQAGTLTDAERGELATLMQRYREGLIRKALAVAEAVRRGLREAPAP